MNGQDPEFEPPTLGEASSWLAAGSFVLVHGIVLLLGLLAVAIVGSVLMRLLHQ
jgi:hypothetical protein